MLIAAPTSPRTCARIAGLFYLANILTIFSSIALFSGLAVRGDAPATAANILAHLARYRLAFASQVMSTAASIAVAAFLYVLFKPVDPGASLTAAFFRVLACALAAAGYVFQLAPLVVAANPYPGVGAAEVQALAQMLGALQTHTRNVSIAFFGCEFLVLAYLIARSTFLPRVLAVLVALGGLGGLLFSASPVPASFLLYFAPLGLVAEVPFALWLSFKGVDERRWHQQAGQLATPAKAGVA